ncbi:LPS export ABC transporter periplasmic protein LptC [Lacimicrobium sp. SS2-24]|uniref:LPS export ABC transporter periplasmic protein LptC n=1 Tax=Lacimicrobium sp. SS2-24 TaxID=2005569 RepID=UPI000B4BDA2E|nr:LPS export ABC transporter periplasmic protein LptC [Lacimicrobium sp. SS2-24]
MKRIYISIALLFLLILATNNLWWLDSEQPESVKQDETFLQPNYLASNMQTRLFNQQGQLAHSIYADSMEHYDLLGFTLFQQPRYKIFVGEGEAPWEVTAEQGTLYEDNRIQLETNVKIVSQDKDGFIRTVTTRFIEINLSEKTMHSDQSVIISGDNYTISGNGFSADLTSKQFELLDHVQTIYGKKS